MSTTKKKTATSFLFTGLTILLVLLGTQPALAIPTAPAQSITLEPSSGAPGSQIVVRGSGFSPGGRVSIYWESTTPPDIGSGPIDQYGTFSTTVTIPLDNVDEGEHTIIAQSTYQEVAYATFTVAVLAHSVDTLILVDYNRMQGIGYSAANVSTLETKINTLVGLPKSQSNMVAVIRRLDLVAWGPVDYRGLWIGNEGLVTSTNNYVDAIDNIIETLKQTTYPNLQYIIIVGAHEVIPMYARPADDMDTPYRESQWVNPLPAGYFKSLYQASGGPGYGHYLTDSVYGDLSYVNNGC